MSKFNFQITDEEGTISTIEFDTVSWVDAFPKFLSVCRGIGYNIDPDVSLYWPSANKTVFGDRDFMIFPDNIEPAEEEDWPKIDQTTEYERSKFFYDNTRNK